MKVTNLSNGTIFLNDLWAIRESQNQGRRGEARYLAGGASIYLPNTSEVLRSAANGTLAASDFPVYYSSPREAIQFFLKKKLIVEGSAQTKAINLRKTFTL